MRKTLKTYGITLTMGAMMPLAFAPHHFYVLAPLGMSMLLYLWSRLSPVRACLTGWLFGIGMFGVGVSWIYISIHRFGGASIPLALSITALFIMVLALFPALSGYFFRRLFPQKHFLTLCILFPTIWTVFEWIRSFLFTGFPWLLIGYSQTASPLRGYAPLVGVYGMTWLTVFSGGLLTSILIQKKRHLYVIVLIALWASGLGLTAISWTHPINNPVKVSLIQGNIPQSLKWDPLEFNQTLERYALLTKAHWNSDIIIWPEAAIPAPLQYTAAYVSNLSTAAKKHHTSLIMGIPIMTQNNAFYNAAIAVGTGKGTYRKKHLVPFGEYLPFASTLGQLMDWIHIPIPNSIPGKHKQALLSAHQIKIGMYICYEVAYPWLVQQDIPEAQLLVTISNDAWFGKSWASWQHLQMGQMAALVSGRYMLFVSNNGVTAVISPQGKILKALPRFTTSVLTTTVQAYTGSTPYTRYF